MSNKVAKKASYRKPQISRKRVTINFLSKKMFSSDQEEMLLAVQTS